jgi:hypothetical protein
VALLTTQMVAKQVEKAPYTPRAIRIRWNRSPHQQRMPARARGSNPHDSAEQMEFKVNAIKEVRHSMFKNGTKVGTMIRMLKSGRFAKRRPKSPSITRAQRMCLSSVRARGAARCKPRCELESQNGVGVFDDQV